MKPIPESIPAEFIVPQPPEPEEPSSESESEDDYGFDPMSLGMDEDDLDCRPLAVEFFFKTSSLAFRSLLHRRRRRAMAPPLIPSMMGDDDDVASGTASPASSTESSSETSSSSPVPPPPEGPPTAQTKGVQKPVFGSTPVFKRDKEMSATHTSVRNKLIARPVEQAVGRWDESDRAMIEVRAEGGGRGLRLTAIAEPEEGEPGPRDPRQEAI